MEGLEMTIDWQNGAPERGRNALPESYKPRALRLAAAESGASADFERSDNPALAHDGPVVDMRKLEADLGRKRLDEIADVVRALTYGEMMELAETMWSVRPNDGELNETNLPGTLYRWSKSREV